MFKFIARWKAKREEAIQTAVAAQRARRLEIAHDYLDGNDNWKEDSK